ncbi:MAG: noncanonical pyrimidine nucleotidase, YjjG family [Clostridiales bacterium]|nr:noncanonical pyrimidine nucleotidase, YjjG family [Clostridiales bacterium]
MKEKTSNFKTILLDADGTLFDFKASERNALSEVFKKYGYALNEEIRKTYERINMDLWEQYELGQIDRNTVIYSRFGKLFKTIGIDDDGVAFEDDYQKILGMQHDLYEDALEVIQYLHGKYDLYIVTNGVTATQMQRLKDSTIDQYMKDIFVSEATGFQKPMKEFFDYCFERIATVDKSRTMIIGDSLTSDMKGGNNAGIVTCWYNPDKLINNTDVVIDIEIHGLRELYQIL